jgi:hypothetical protein
MKLLAVVILAAGATAMNLAAHLQLDGTQLDLRGSAVTDADLARLGDQPFRSVRSVLLASTSISDRGLSHLKGLPLEVLDLDRTAVTNCGLEQLAGLPLRRLTLSGTAVNDAGLASLAALPLEELRAASTAIGDDGLEHLRTLPLRRLDLSRTQVTDAGLDALAAIGTLELVDLSFTRVTGRGLQVLGGLPRLGTVVAYEVPVDEAERAALQRARPGLQLVTELPTR